MATIEDEFIWHCLQKYLVDGDRADLKFLDDIPEMYKHPPKNKCLYRGILIQKQDMEAFEKSPLMFTNSYMSFTTSLSTAKDFARGICTEYKVSKRGTKMIGVVYRIHPEPENIVISVGSFLRRSSIAKADLKNFRGENEYIVKHPPNRYRKHIIWSTDKVMVHPPLSR